MEQWKTKVLEQHFQFSGGTHDGQKSHEQQLRGILEQVMKKLLPGGRAVGMMHLMVQGIW